MTKTWLKMRWIQKSFLISASTTVFLFIGMSYVLLSKDDLGRFQINQHRRFSSYTEGGKRILIPSQKKEKEGWKTLVLDMDEMLVGNATEIQQRKSKSEKLIPFKDGSFSHIHRPYLKEFLEYATANFEVIIWTAGTKNYAQECIRNILQANSLPSHTFDFVIARDPSWFEITPTSWYKKDLLQLGRSTDHVLMFENSPVVLPVSNAIIVAEFVHSKVFDTYSEYRERESVESVGLSNNFFDAFLPAPQMCTKSVVIPCSSLTPNEDATLLTSKEIIKRWKLSSRKVDDFLKQEIERGVLYEARIKRYGSPEPETMVTLPLHRAVR